MKIMQRILLAVLMLCSVFCVSAEPAQAEQAVGVDLVILLDQGKSMATTDQEALRLEAVQALINLVDTETSRVGVALFTEKLLTPDNVLQKMVNGSNVRDRQSLLSFFRTKKTELNDSENNNYMWIGKDFSEALKAAKDMLATGGNGNRKVIILLTDGETTFYKQGEEDVARKRTAEKKAKELVNSPAMNGVQIYPVYLKPANKNANTSLLNELAIATGVSGCVTVKPAELTDEFVRIFKQVTEPEVAVEVGRSAFGKNGGKDSVQIDVPNNSLQELNIVLTRRGNADAQFRLTGPDGKAYTKDSGNVCIRDLGHYIVCKLVSPQAGAWELSFTTGTVDKLEYMYSYDLTADISLSADVFQKHETIQIRAWFEDDGVRRTDHELYGGVKATARIDKMANGRWTNVCADIALATDAGGSCYLWELDMERVLSDAYGKGEYRVTVSFAGDGLECSPVQKTFTMLNTAPQAKDLPALRFEFGNPRTGKDTPAQTVQLAKDGYVTDANGDELTFRLSGTLNGIGISCDEATGALTIAENDVALTGDVLIRASDGDGGEVTLRQRVIVEDLNGMFDGYAIELKVRDAEVQGDTAQLAKRQAYTVELRAVIPEGKAPEADIFQPEMWYVDGDRTVFLTDVHREESADGSIVYVGTFGEKEHAADYVISASARFGSAAPHGTLRTDSCSVHVVNHAPAAKGEQIVLPGQTLYYGDPDGVLPDDDDQCTIDLMQYVSDVDGDPLTFDIEREEQYAAMGLTARIDGNRYLVIGENDRELSDVELVIRATDNDGASMKMYQRVTVIDRDCKYDDYRVRLNLRDQETGAYLSAEEDGAIRLDKWKAYTVELSPVIPAGKAAVDALHQVKVWYTVGDAQMLIMMTKVENTAVYTGELPAQPLHGSFAIEAVACFGQSAEHGVEVRDSAAVAVVNQEPYQTKSLETQAFMYNHPDQENTTEKKIRLSDYVQDDDDAALTYELVDYPKAGVNAVLADKTTGEIIISLADHPQPVTDGHVHVVVKDGDGGECTLSIPVETVNRIGVYDAYDIALRVMDASGNEVRATDGAVSLEKGATYTVVLTPVRDGGPYSAKLYDSKVGLSVNGAAPDEINLTVRPNGEYEGFFSTGETTMTYTIRAEARFGSIRRDGTGREAQLTAIVGNQPPVVNEDWNELYARLSEQENAMIATLLSRPGEAVYWIEDFLVDKATGDVALDLTKAFTDPDGAEDPLRYSASLRRTEEPAARPLMSGDAQGQLTITADDLNGVGGYVLEISCMDNDGQGAWLSFDFVVVSLQAQGLPNVILAGVILALLAISVALIIHQCKPAYAQGLLRLYFCSIPQPVEKALPTRGLAAKRKLKLSWFYVDRIGEVTQGKISRKQLTHIRFRPTKGGELSVRVDKGILNELQITVGRQEMNRRSKKATLRPGEKLIIRAEGCPAQVGFELRK